MSESERFIPMLAAKNFLASSRSTCDCSKRLCSLSIFISEPTRFKIRNTMRLCAAKSPVVSEIFAHPSVFATSYLPTLDCLFTV